MRLAREGREIVAREGLGGLVRRAFWYCLRPVYWRREWYLWRSDVGGSPGAPAAKTAGARLEVVNGLPDLERLISGGLCFSPPFSAREARGMLAGRKVGLMTVVDGGVASWIWAAVDARARIYPPLKKMDYTREAYLGHALTSPRYRGQGVVVAQYDRQAQFLRSRGKSVAVSTTLVGNDAGRKVEQKVGSVRCGRVTLDRVLMWGFWTEEWDDGR